MAIKVLDISKGLYKVALFSDNPIPLMKLHTIAQAVISRVAAASVKIAILRS
jgi:hypothetical protein